MKFKFLSAFCAALITAAPAYAQSSMVMIIGSFPTAPVQVERTPLSIERQIELAAERACERPFIRNVAGQVAYRECLVAARAEAEAIVAERALANVQVASR